MIIPFLAVFILAQPSPTQGICCDESEQICDHRFRNFSHIHFGDRVMVRQYTFSER